MSKKWRATARGRDTERFYWHRYAYEYYQLPSAPILCAFTNMHVESAQMLDTEDSDSVNFEQLCCEMKKLVFTPTDHLFFCYI